MKKYLYIISLPLLIASCTHTIGPTEVSVTEPIKHFNPVVMGKSLNFEYTLVNVGDEPFVITDVQPSCGCITMLNMKTDKKMQSIIPSGDSLTLGFRFDASKNIGYVNHIIRVFGNVEPNGMIMLKFDLNIVPPVDYIPDYEEIYERKSVI